MNDNEFQQALNSDTEESRNLIRKWASTMLLIHGMFIKYEANMEALIYWKDYGIQNRN